MSYSKIRTLGWMKMMPYGTDKSCMHETILIAVPGPLGIALNSFLVITLTPSSLGHVPPGVLAPANVIPMSIPGELKTTLFHAISQVWGIVSIPLM